MQRPRLVYFDMRGRAEAIRLLLHATDTEFEEQRVVSSEEWTELQPRLPFGVLPVYEDEAGLLCESHAILRHLGRTLCAPLRDERERSLLDAAHEALAEAQEDLWRFQWTERYADRLESYAEATLRPRLERLESWFTRGRTGPHWFAEVFTPVDCLAFCFLDELDAFFPAVLADFRELAALRSRVAALPGIAGYLASGARPGVFGIGRLGPKVDPRVAFEAASLFHNPWTPPLDLAEAARGQRRLTGRDG